MNLGTSIYCFGQPGRSGCHGPRCGRPKGGGKAYTPSKLGGNANQNWKDIVEKTGKKFPPKVLEGLKVDWTDMHLAGGFASSPMGNRILVGMGDVIVKDAIAHELSHVAYDKLSQPLKDEAEKLFGKKWIVQTDITKPYQHASWKREGFGDDYAQRMAARKQVQEQTAEAIRAYIREEPLPVSAKNWAKKALDSLK